MSEMEKIKLKLDQKKKEILLKEKILKEKEKQAKARKFKEIGNLASKANLDTLEMNILLGAFLEISDKIEEKDSLNDWKIRAENFLDKTEKNNQSPILISFIDDPSRETKNLLKESGFKWNNFRKEYHGYGKKSEIENILKNTNFKIEVLDC